MRHFLLAFAFVFAAISSQAAFAKGPGGKKKNKNHHGDQKCAAVKQACIKAGYTKGGHDRGKGLSKDCIDKLIEGQKVAGVALDPKEAKVAECRVRLTSFAKGGHQQKPNSAAFAPAPAAPAAAAPATATAPAAAATSSTKPASPTPQPTAAKPKKPSSR